MDSNIFKLVDFEAIDGNSFGQNIVYFIPMGFILEGEIVTFANTNLQPNLSELISFFEQFVDFTDLYLLHSVS